MLQTMWPGKAVRPKLAGMKFMMQGEPHKVHKHYSVLLSLLSLLSITINGSIMMIGNTEGWMKLQVAGKLQ